RGGGDVFIVRGGDGVGGGGCGGVYGRQRVAERAVCEARCAAGAGGGGGVGDASAGGDDDVRAVQRAVAGARGRWIERGVRGWGAGRGGAARGVPVVGGVGAERG